MKLLISVRIEYRHFLTCNFLKNNYFPENSFSGSYKIFFIKIVIGQQRGKYGVQKIKDQNQKQGKMKVKDVDKKLISQFKKEMEIFILSKLRIITWEQSLRKL